MEAKQVKDLMEAYASVYAQPEEVIAESECECEDEKSEKETPEMNGKKKGKKEEEKKEEITEFRNVGLPGRGPLDRIVNFRNPPGPLGGPGRGPRFGNPPGPLGGPGRGPRFEEVETDLFDVILEYLVAEGYADTNKAALAIMTNMSEEWKQDIVEAKYGTKKGRHRLAMKRVKGEEIGKSGPGTGFKAVEKAAKEGGAKDPAAVAAAAMYKTYGGK